MPTLNKLAISAFDTVWEYVNAEGDCILIGTQQGWLIMVHILFNLFNKYKEEISWHASGIIRAESSFLY